MKIQRLFLNNVRGIKSLDLDFRDPATSKPMSRIVLAVANGSGKTTILECIFGLLSAAEKYGAGKRDRYLHSLPDVTIDITDPAQLQLIFEVKSISEKPVTLSVYYGPDRQTESELSVSEEAHVGGASSSRRVRQIKTTISEKSPLFAQLAESIQNASKREGEAIGSVLYFPHDRYLPSVEQGALGFEPRLYQWAFRYRANDEWKGSTESYLFSLNYLDLEDRDRKVSANRFGQTVELVNSILLDKRIARIEKGRVVVETTSGQTHGLNDLSSGEKQLVLMLIEIARRVVPGSVILIDEPEISLHPTWQRGLVAALDKIIEQYDAQVILATHSLEIATSVMPEEVISLSDLDNLPRGEWKPEKEALG